MKQQTAVEWLWRWINDNQEATIEQGNKAFEQAKAMEKEQIIKAHGDKYVEFDEVTGIYVGDVITGEQYYNETYNK